MSFGQLMFFGIFTNTKWENMNISRMELFGAYALWGLIAMSILAIITLIVLFFKGDL